MLEKEMVQGVLKAALSGGADWADLFMEDTFNTQLRTLNGEIKDINSGNRYGAGVRAVYGSRVVYAYSNDCSEAGLLAVARVVASNHVGQTNGAGHGGVDLRGVNVRKHWVVQDHPLRVNKRDKLALMQRAHTAAMVGAVRTVEVWLHDVTQRVLVANTHGLWAEDERVRVRLSVNAIAEDGTLQSTGNCYPGASTGYEFFQGGKPEEAGAEAARAANAMLHAKPAPSGKMPVVVGNGFGGIVFHEACGHSLETTSVAKNASQFVGKLGEKIAHESVTAIDDGTIAGAWGSINMDDEGEATQRTVLIDKGVLTSYLVDRVGAIETGYAPTGSGRRQNYTFAPTSRMRSTFIDNGESTPNDLFKQVEYGVYARSMGGGSVEPGTGDYNFCCNEAYIIRKGEVCEAVNGVSFVGNGGADLHNIVGVANDVALGQGMCGSSSGSLPVDVGQPHLLISEMVVGGQS